MNLRVGALVCLVLLVLTTALPAASAPVSLRWYLRWDQYRIDNVAIPIKEAFESQYPNIKLEIENAGNSLKDYWEKLQTMVAGGVAPDILYPATHNAFALAMAGELLDLSPYIQRDKVSMGEYLNGIIDLYTWRNEVYALPVDWARQAMFYNEDMFNAAGLPAPAADWTWDEFLGVSRRLTRDNDGDGVNDQYAIRDFKSFWPLVAWSFTGTSLYDDARFPTHTRIDSPEVIRAIQFVGDLFNEYKVMPMASGDYKEAFAGGLAAMEIKHHGAIPAYLQLPGFTWDLAPLPRGTISVNRVDGSGFSINKRTAHPNEAWLFVRFLAAPDGMGIRKLVELQQNAPIVKRLITSDMFLNPPNQRKLNKMAFLAGEKLFTMYDPIHPIYDELDKTTNDALKKVWSGQKPAQEVALTLAPVLNAKLASIKH